MLKVEMRSQGIQNWEGRGKGRKGLSRGKRDVERMNWREKWTKA